MQTASLARSLIHWTAQQTRHAMTQPTDDLDLIRRMKAGDHDAVRHLYELYGQRLYAYALRLTRDPTAAEDVTQNTLVTAWRTARTFRGEGRLIAWLLSIVHHTAMKAMRNAPPDFDKAAEETVPDDQPSPEEQAQCQEMKRWVRQGLQSLSPEHRAVLELVFYQGLSLNEAAKVLDCPLGTVKSRLSYARQYLRGVLARGRILYRGSPAEMLKASEGHVWTLTLPGLEKPDHDLTVVSMLHLAEGTQYRLVGCSAEGYPTALQVQPGLEDGYVWLMKQSGVADVNP